MKKKFLSLLCLVLALTMVFGLVACTAQEEPVVDEPVVEEPAVEGGEETREPVELTFYTYAAVVGSGKDATIAAVNEYLKEKLNTTVDFQIYAQGEYGEVVNTMFNSGAPMDCLLVGTTGVDFSTNVARNAFVALDDYIDTYLPGTKERLPESAWEAYTYNGSVYGVAAVRDLANQLGMWVNQDLLDDLGVEFPADTYETYFDLVDFWREVKAARDAKYPEKAGQPLVHIQQTNRPAYWFNVDSYAGGMHTPLALANIPTIPSFSSIAEDGSEVTALYFTEEYREWVKTIRTLIEEGIYSISDDQNEEMENYLANGDALGSNVWGDVSVSGRVSGYEATMHYAKNATLISSGYLAVGFAIPNQCTNVERTLEVLELMNTDQYLATLLHFGPEGEGWTDADNDGVLEFEGTLNEPADITERYWYQWYGNGMGAVTASKAPAGYPADFADKIYEQYANGVPSANLGFTFDATNVQTEMAACNSVVAEYTTILEHGRAADVDTVVDEFIAKLKASGVETIIAECQAQLDAWRAEKGL